MKWFLILAILFGAVNAAPSAEESLGTKIKKVLEPDSTPTPVTQTSKTLDEEADAYAVADCFAPAKGSNAYSDAEKQIKAQESFSYSSPGRIAVGNRDSVCESAGITRRGSRKKGWPNVSLSPDAIEDFEKYPPKVRQILDAGLALTKQNLYYTYGSADPANGGMDCSGFIYYVLQQNGFPDVPRDSSQQYIWVRKAGNFDAVLVARRIHSSSMILSPATSFFWRGTYNIGRDPPITHTMIYLGREKRTNKRVMIGSSDGRTYDGKQRWGVSVFDFKIPPPPKSGDAKISPVFVGYGRIPGLPAQ